MYNLTGRRFGRLTVLEKTDKRYKSSIVWHCQCDCGATVDVPSEWLLRGIKQSCGCLQRESRLKDYTGVRVGKLTAIRLTGEVQDGGAVWLWRCDCGETVERPTSKIWSPMTMCEKCRRALNEQQAETMRERREQVLDPKTGLVPGQIENLRDGKLQKNNTSGVRGVTWHSRVHKWQVRVFKNNKVFYSAYFDSLEEAKAAREKALQRRLEE